MNYEIRYSKLNERQKQAVNTIEGPVMVVAGPGTGKTELLSMRAANILRRTDMLPENILCLTFTESGSIAMQKRLVDIIGREAYGISVFTFHAFGSEIISRYREYFYNGADFNPADELTRHKIITDILQELPPKNPLKTMMNGEFTSVGMIISAISDIKRAGLEPKELTAILDANDEVIDIAEPLLIEAFSARVNKNTFDKLASVSESLAKINEPQPIPTISRLSDILRASLKHSLEEASEHPKITPPLTKWRTNWMTKSEAKKPIMTARKQQIKLRALVDIYEKYLENMQSAKLYDFDDMISQVVHAIEQNPSLQAELQEKYQYIMVDEFQDTNHAQMRILHALTNNPANEGNPNLMVVGDDDQAIYSFQGADIGNILDFKKHYKNAKLITLIDNYRSAECILTAAREVITQGSERLENQIDELDKNLSPHALPEKPNAEIVTLPSEGSEREWIARDIKDKLKNGQNPGDIAILARRHADLVSLLPYLAKAQIPVSYDQNDNVLDNDLVSQILYLSNIVDALANNDLGHANELLPQMMAHPAWNFNPEILWQISLKAYKNRLQWLEVLQSTPETKPFANWLISCARASKVLPMERILDLLSGIEIFDENYTSPLKSYFLAENNAERISHLQNLIALRTKLREHQPDLRKARLSDLLEFVKICQQTNTTITIRRHIGQDSQSVKLMSAHASKGLEFDTVYLIGATDTNWGSKASRGGNKIAYPENLRLRNNNDSPEERLRLFFVGMTRAKRQLIISRALQSESGKELMLANFLAGELSLKATNLGDDFQENHKNEIIEIEWYAPIIGLPQATMRDLLDEDLARYKLSATHVNAFIDITRGGPQSFLLNNILHFPSARSPYASYGTAIHTALQFAHDSMLADSKTPPPEQIIDKFKSKLENEPLTAEELNHFTQKGIDALNIFLQNKLHSFTRDQRAELNFSNQQATFKNVRLTGKIDVASIDEKNKTIAVTDYKTGSPLHAWNKGADYDRIKAHKYRQQLLFYKLLAENSRDWKNYKFIDGILQFVEPDKAGDIIDIRLQEVSEEELTNFTTLLEAIWHHIQNLNFPDTSNYSKDYAGVLEFEDDLKRGKFKNSIDTAV